MLPQTSCRAEGSMGGVQRGSPVVASGGSWFRSAGGPDNDAHKHSIGPHNGGAQTGTLYVVRPDSDQLSTNTLTYMTFNAPQKQ
jgi:hypothetical protein